MKSNLKEDNPTKSAFEELDIETEEYYCNEDFREGSDDGNSLVFSPGKRRNDWQIFTSHGLVLLSILNNPGRTIREIGLELNLTDRSVALALADLVESGFLVRERIGRRTFYHVNEEHPLRYPVNQFAAEEKIHLTVRALRAENLATHAPETSGGSA